ncbi:MAG: DUF4399 domain-containing protein [Pseudomonadales bacterium]|nr:DUF4399 domain-containing protein [Pseudomonadales bacterium]
MHNIKTFRSGVYCLGFMTWIFSAAIFAQVETAISDSAHLYIVSPADNEVVPQTFKVVFGLSGMGVAPAGVQREKTGHHHLLIDLDVLPDMSKSLPSSENIVHFGGGQTEAWLTLVPGEHTLQLLLGDYLHRPHSAPVLSKKITITVK